MLTLLARSLWCKMWDPAVGPRRVWPALLVMSSLLVWILIPWWLCSPSPLSLWVLLPLGTLVVPVHLFLLLWMQFRPRKLVQAPLILGAADDCASPSPAQPMEAFTRKAALQVAHQVATAAAEGLPVCVRRSTGDAHSTRTLHYKNLAYSVDLSHLDRIRCIDVAGRTVVADAQVSMRELVDTLLPFGLMPCVVPEFENITVGGAITGLGIESSSFRHGLFEDTVEEIQVVLGDGSLCTVSPNQNADLFFGMFGSFGSLVFVVAAKIRCMPVQPYVRVEVTAFSHRSAMLARVRQICQQSLEEEEADHHAVDFLDAVVYDHNFNCIFEGKFCEPQEGKSLDTISALRWTDPIFAERILDSIHICAEPLEPSLRKECAVGNVVGRLVFKMELRNYLFRFDRGCFFMMDNPPYWERLLTGWTFDSRNLFRQGIRSWSDREREGGMMTQDVCIPLQKARHMLMFCQMYLDIRPLWLCPILNTRRGPKIFSLGDDDEKFHINVGIYGEYQPEVVRRPGFSPDQYNRDLEQLVHQLGGHKALYAHAYYSRSEFAECYDVARYQALRDKYHAEGRFIDIYDKVCVMQPTVSQEGEGAAGAAVTHHQE